MANIYEKLYFKKNKKKGGLCLTIGENLAILGHIENIVYNTMRIDNKFMKFIHKFKKDTKIYTDGKNLIIPGVEVSERGIE